MSSMLQSESEARPMTKTEVPPMTEAQWKTEESRLKGAVTRAKTKVTKVVMLAEKIEAKAAQKAAEATLREHRLNYFELVAR